MTDDLFAEAYEERASIMQFDAGMPRADAEAAARADTKLFRVWAGMITRCTNKNHHSYRLYGGRGIVVCDRWLCSYEAFVADMGRPSAGMSIDRINTNGNYEPSNCRWATSTEQNRNRRNNRFVTFNGEKIKFADVLEKAGIKRHSVTNLMRYKNRTLQDAFDRALSAV